MTGLAVLTSGGDAQGMNAAVRAVVRTALHHGAEVHTVHEGYQGLVDGGAAIRPAGWDDVAGILDRGGTVLGTARSAAFRDRAGRRRAVRHLVERGIDRLVVVGGDGSLTGGLTLHDEWAGLLDEAVAAGEVDRALAGQHRALVLVGLAGSIDNDIAGVDMAIGTDTAIHRIVEAIDSIDSTAASHRRTFIVEVMGRHCGHLALASAVAGGADYVLVPESPPAPGWEEDLCALLRAGRAAGRRNSVVVIAEGARDAANRPITTDDVRRLLEERLGEEIRVTNPGHVQRGGAPSAFDRATASVLGYTAAVAALSTEPEAEPRLVGLRGHDVVTAPLRRALDRTRLLAERAAARDFAAVRELRGPGFAELLDITGALARALPDAGPTPARRIAVVNVGGLAPGMNAAARVAVRLGLRRGLTVLGVHGGLRGLADDTVRELGWGDVCGWAPEGGARLGVDPAAPTPDELPAIGRALRRHGVQGLLLVGGWAAFAAAVAMAERRAHDSAFALPVAVLPASIGNDVPGTEMAVGADTALNHIVDSIDRIRQAGAAQRHCFVLETMGGHCGYLALLGGLSGGAVRVYLPEEDVTAQDLAEDVRHMVRSFAAGQRLFLAVRAERAEAAFTTDFLRELFQRAGNGMFDARQVVLGQTQQGGRPSPADRVLATRFAARAVGWLGDRLAAAEPEYALVGLRRGGIQVQPLAQVAELADLEQRRPREQWWLRLRPIVDVLARRPVPESTEPIGTPLLAGGS